MDSEALKARAIELSERAYRQKARASSVATKQRLDDAGDELIRLDNLDRFYVAGTMLEAGQEWTEEQRALAHELNGADQTMRGIEPLTSGQALQMLDKLSGEYSASQNQQTQQTGQNISQTLQKLSDDLPAKDQKTAYNYLLALIESVLEHIRVHDDNPINNTVLLLRNMRDSLLSARELLFDENELLAGDKIEDQQVDKVELARETLNEIYEHIKPVDFEG